MNCKTCEHFVEDDDEGFGRCGVFWANLLNDADPDGLRTDKVHIRDHFDLLVGEDFGCIHHEEKA